MVKSLVIVKIDMCLEGAELIYSWWKIDLALKSKLAGNGGGGGGLMCSRKIQVGEKWCQDLWGGAFGSCVLMIMRRSLEESYIQVHYVRVL